MSLIYDANELFGDMRDTSPEELERINSYLDSISKPTGINVIDLLDEGEISMTNDIHFYSAFVNAEDPPFAFNLSEVKIHKVLENGAIILEDYVFTGPDDSTNVFNGVSIHKTGEMYQLGRATFAYYDTSKEACLEWLKMSMNTAADFIHSLYDAIKSAEIKDRTGGV